MVIEFQTVRFFLIILLCPSGLHLHIEAEFHFSIFYIHQTLFGLSGIQLGSYSECLKNNTKISNHENQLRDNSRGGKAVFPIHMSDSRFQIAPQSPEKNHGAWDNTYICRDTLHLYFREDLQV